jgi:hypothetical protein
MNVGMLACYDQAKEVCAKILNDPMINGPSLSTQLMSSAVAVSLSNSYENLWFTCCLTFICAIRVLLQRSSRSLLIWSSLV